MLALLHVDGVTNSHALREALGRIQRFVVGDENRGYAFAHPLFAEHFRSRLPEAEVRVIEERFLDYGKHTLAGLNDGSIKPETASKYIVSYYGAHLERMHCGIAELAELTSRSWSLASEIVDDSGVGYLADIERVLGAAHEANLRAGATNGVVLPFIGTVMRCFFIRSRCFVFRKNVPDDLLSLLVESHIWPINRALAYAYQHDDPFVRARRVIAILHGTATEAPSIKNHIVHTAVTELRKIDPSYTTLLLDSVPGMLALLAGELVDSQSALHLLSTAVTLADKLPSGGIDKSKAYLQLARQYARRGEYRLALQVAQREKNDNLALAAIVEEMAELRLVDKALIIAEGISCGQERGRAMLAIAKVLPKCKRKQTLIDQALHEIRKIASDEDRALLLGTAFGMLSDETNTTGLLKEALRGLKRTSELRLEILIEVLKNSTIESTQAQVLGEIIRLVRTSPNFYNQWVPYIVREMGRMKRFTEAQEFARSMPRSAEYLVQALTALAQTMPSDEMKRLVVMEALHNCRESVRHRYGQSWKIEEGQPVCINEIFSNADVDDECFDEKWCPVSNWVDAMLDTTNRCRRREVVIEARQLAEAFMDSDEPRDLFTIIGVISGNESLRELMQKVHVRGSDVVCCRVVQAFIAHPDDVREVMAVLFGASLLLVEKSNEIYDKVLYPRSKEPRQSATQQLYRLFAAVLARLSSNGRGRNTFEISDLMHTIGYLGKRQAINETADSFSEIENW
jgi:tetratricopeptide (TPR) repeat protein